MHTDTPRRGFLRSACRHCAGFAAMLALPALADDDALPARFKRPAADTDEGGLWSMMDREETRIRRSPLAIKEPALSAYLTGVTAALAGSHAPDIRVHVVRMPLFNAAMAPNGMMMVWSGMLLRVENEAQLAAILGHELGHYLERHQVEQLRTAKDRAVISTLVGLVGGAAATIGQLGILASLFAFSREHEARADRMGVRLMKQSGYDGHEASRVWDNLLAEMKITGGDNVGERSPMFATHPPVANRRDELDKLAGAAGGALKAAEYRKAIAPYRFAWIEDEIKRGQYEESLVLFDRMLKLDAQDAEVLFARGEIYRQRGDQGDEAKCLADLGDATRSEKAPAAAFRSLGLALKARGDTAQAVPAFEKYLSLAPQAPDAPMIRAHLTELKS